MKRFILHLSCLFFLASCERTSDVPFTELRHYYFKNGQEIPDNPKIEEEEAFVTLFGMAAIMGEDGKPTPIDWSNEFVIAVVNPVTNYLTELTSESLHLTDGELVYTYNETIGEKLTWSMQPILLVKVDRKYETEIVSLDRRLQVLSDE